MKIRLIFFDIDGTLTDGKIYVGANGEMMKAFDVKDGYAIYRMLPEHDIIPVIITGRTSEIVKRRAGELGISELYQGITDKTGTLRAVMEKYGCEMENAAYFGDDIPDLAAMEQCGLKGCPADAVAEVKNICDYICAKNGGNGAAREFIEWMLRRVD